MGFLLSLGTKEAQHSPIWKIQSFRMECLSLSFYWSFCLLLYHIRHISAKCIFLMWTQQSFEGRILKFLRNMSILKLVNWIILESVLNWFHQYISCMHYDICHVQRNIFVFRVQWSLLCWLFCGIWVTIFNILVRLLIIVSILYVLLILPVMDLQNTSTSSLLFTTTTYKFWYRHLAHM